MNPAKEMVTRRYKNSLQIPVPWKENHPTSFGIPARKLTKIFKSELHPRSKSRLKELLRSTWPAVMTISPVASSLLSAMMVPLAK